MEYLTFSSSFGAISIVWKKNKSDLQLQRIFLSDPKQSSENKVLESFKQVKSGSTS